MHRFQHLRGRRVRCILFDLGETLWDPRRGAVQAKRAANPRLVALLRRHLAPEALPTTDDELLGRQFHETFVEYERAMARRDPEREPNGPQAVVDTLRRWGIEGVDHTLAAALFEAINISMAEERLVFDDVIPTLATLQQRGFLLGVATNRRWGGKLFRDDLQTLGLLDYLDRRAIAVSADVGVRKPHPALFLHALSGVGVAPEEAAMVGDSLRKDILGAQALGMITVWKPRPKHRHKMDMHVAHGGTLLGVQRGLHTPPLHAPPLPQTGEDGDLPDKTLGREGSVEAFLRGEITPDVIIEQVSDLLRVFD
jgi:HAD superfamily hydrolase (TIGR01509 family)